MMVLSNLARLARRGDLLALQALRAEERMAEPEPRGPTHCNCGCGVAILQPKKGQARLYLDRNHARRAHDRGVVRDLSDVRNAKPPAPTWRPKHCLAGPDCHAEVRSHGYCHFHWKRVLLEMPVDWEELGCLGRDLTEPLGHGGALRRTIDADWRANHKRRSKP